MSRHLLYHRELDDSIGTWMTDYLVAGVMFITSIILIHVYRRQQRGKPAQNEKHDLAVIKNKDDDEFLDNSGMTSATTAEEMMTSFVYGTVTTVFLLISFGCMFVLGGTVHNRVQHVNTSTLFSDQIYLSNIRARDAILPYHLMWTLACVGGGFVAAAFIVLAHDAARTDVKMKEVTEAEQQRSRATTDNSIVGLIHVSTTWWRTCSLRHLCTRHPRAMKVVFYGTALAIAVGNACLQSVYLATYVMDTDVDRWLYRNYAQLNTLQSGIFKMLDWTRLWRMMIPSVLLASANLVCALVLTYLRLTSGKSPQSISRALLLQCCGVWVIFIGGMLQLALAQCRHHEHQEHETMGTTKQSCMLPLDFNHNAIYHLVTGVGAVILAATHMRMEVVGARMSAEYRLRHRSLRHCLDDPFVV